MNFDPSQTATRSLSVRIGRIVVRLLLLGLVIWGATRAYQAYVSRQRAQEIAPIHAYALELLVAFKEGNYFAVQEHLDPKMQRTVSIDWLAYFAENSELNATQTGRWQEWNNTHENNGTVYNLQGTLVYTNTHTKPMVWTIKKEGDGGLHVLRLTIGKRLLVPLTSSRF